jgi:PhnB protein
MTLNPYLGFNGQCKEAFDLYKSLFGGEFIVMSQYKDAPESAGMKYAPEHANRIMHVSLPVGSVTLMGSDMPGEQVAEKAGYNISVSVNVDDEKEADRIFKGLSDGGNVEMPMTKTFWNAYFGTCTDAFGIHWMVNCDLQGRESFDVKNES